MRRRKMKEMLFSRRQVMEMCKAVFNFDEYGIKPYLKDIKFAYGSRFLSYYFEGSDNNEYEVKFSVIRRRLMLTIYKEEDINTLSQIKLYVYHIDLNNWCLSPVYQSSLPESPVFSGIIDGKYCIYLDMDLFKDNSPSGLL